MMPECKTQFTDASVEDTIAARASEKQLADCHALTALLGTITGEPPRLGRHRMGKVCLYVKQLADLDMEVFEQIVRGSLAAVQRRYGCRPAAASAVRGGPTRSRDGRTSTESPTAGRAPTGSHPRSAR